VRVTQAFSIVSAVLWLLSFVLGFVVWVKGDTDSGATALVRVSFAIGTSNGSNYL
jgi:hypothetical protein